MVQQCFVRRWNMCGNKNLVTCTLGYEKHYYKCASHTANGSACLARLYVQGKSDNELRITYCGSHNHAPPGNRLHGTGQWGVTPKKIQTPCVISGTSTTPASAAPTYTARRATVSTPQTSCGIVHATSLHHYQGAEQLQPKAAALSPTVATPARSIRARRSTIKGAALRKLTIAVFPNCERTAESTRSTFQRPGLMCAAVTRCGF
jgi:WRKY DNA -binding domain